MKYLIILLLLGLTLAAAIDMNEEFTDFYDFLDKFNAAEDKQAMINSYITWQTSEGFPAIVNDSHAVFIYYTTATTSTVAVAGDHNGWNPNNGYMTRLAQGYNFFYRAEDFESDARIDYKFVLGQNWILDPRNPNQVLGGYGPNSELAMPDFVQPADIIKKNGVPEGHVQIVPTSFSSANPTMRIYLPPGYDNTKSYSTAYFADGSEYLDQANAATVLDNLIYEGRIEPIIGVFVNPAGYRHSFYNCSNDEYENYIDELVPFIDSMFATNATAEGRLHAGASLGGQISMHMGLERTEIFKNIGLHSPALWDGASSLGRIGCSIKETYASTPASDDLRVWMSAGSYEEEIFNDTQKVECETFKKGWDYDVMYLHEGHSWGSWRHTLNDMLEFFFSSNAAPEHSNPCPEDDTVSTESTTTSELNNTTTSTTGTTSSGYVDTGNNSFFGMVFLIPLLSFFRCKK
ncbi:MAG: esterase family protein [Candidatus Heimdallarchaeota archaeon]|nr:esterase family protein [Candidatus Heimdallarchaeota archaeon]